jgi:hypothetical protein
VRRSPFTLLPCLALACADDPMADPTAGATTGADPATTSLPTTGAEPTTGDTGDTGDTGEPLLAPADRLIRISMALRGIRPGESQLAAVEQDPAALAGIVDDYLTDARLGATLRDLHNDALLVLTDFAVPPAGFLMKDTLAGMDPYAANRAIMEAPLRLIEHVVMSGRPYREIVTADYTLADAAVAGAWGLAHAGEGWQVVDPPSDLRRAGILADAWFFTIHGSTVSNAGRGRANAVARALLCQDFLDRDIEIDASVNLADPNEVAEAVQQNPSCVACHQQLDPLASFFEGYKLDVIPLLSTYPIDRYAKGYFTQILNVDMRAPHYFGTPGDSLGDLGAMISADPRFSLCAAQRAYAYFHQIPLGEVPWDRAADLQAELIASDMDYRAMLRALVLADDFLVSTGPVGRKRSRPGQLAAAVHDLTGFRWRADLTAYGAGQIDLMDDSLLGYHVLTGGIDSIFVQQPSHTYNATASLTLRALARQAASFVVESEFDEPDPAKRKLLKLVSATDKSPETVRPQLVALHRRFYGQQLADDSPEIDETWDLFDKALAANNQVPRAWKTTLMALLQDVRIAFY